MSARDQLRALNVDTGDLADETVVDLCRLADKYDTTPEAIAIKAIEMYVRQARRALR